MAIHYAKDDLESYNTNVSGEVKINEARRDSFLTTMSHFGAITFEVTHMGLIRNFRVHSPTFWLHVMQEAILRVTG